MCPSPGMLGNLEFRRVGSSKVEASVCHALMAPKSRPPHYGQISRNNVYETFSLERAPGNK